MHDHIDWHAIERSPAFRELVASRRRFVVTVGGGAIAATVAFILVAYLASGVLGADVVSPITLGFVLGVGLIAMTWIVTLAYLRKSDREWAPLERRIAEQAGATASDQTGRFVRQPADREERVR